MESKKAIVESCHITMLFFSYPVYSLKSNCAIIVIIKEIIGVCHRNKDTTPLLLVIKVFLECHTLFN